MTIFTVVVGWLLTAIALLMVVGMGIHGVISRKADTFTDVSKKLLKFECCKTDSNTSNTNNLSMCFVFRNCMNH